MTHSIENIMELFNILVASIFGKLKAANQMKNKATFNSFSQSYSSNTEVQTNVAHSFILLLRCFFHTNNT